MAKGGARKRRSPRLLGEKVKKLIDYIVLAKPYTEQGIQEEEIIIMISDAEGRESAHSAIKLW